MSSIVELSKLIEFSSKRIIKKDVVEADGFNIALICLNSGQEISPHMEGYDAAFYVLDGEGVFTIGSEQIAAEKGSIVMSPKEKLRGIKSLKQMSLLGVREEIKSK
jgi:quercetin dioxygenase-like cupin family protein